MNKTLQTIHFLRTIHGDFSAMGFINDWERLGFQHYLDWFYVKWTGKPAIEKIATGKVLEFQERLMKSDFCWPTTR